MGTTPPTLPLSIVCDVTVQVLPAPIATPTFNQALIIGTSGIIPTTGANSRMRLYTNISQMTADGFTTSMPEYIAAQLYWSQVPAPVYLWIGAQGTGETPLQALQACRAQTAAWWACMSTTATTADHTAIAAWIEAVTPVGFYFYTTEDPTVLTTGGIFATLKALKYRRDFGLYTTAANGGPYGVAGVMGIAMGFNTGLANSYFILKFKEVVGVPPEPLTVTQVNTLEGNNGNVILNYANVFSWVEQGATPSGEWFDQVLGLDMLASDIQYSVVNVLTGSPAIPMTDPGEAQLVSAVNDACERARARGFIAPGVWNGQVVLNIGPGTPLPLGYLSQSQSFVTQAPGDRTLRKAMPIYTTVILSEGVHSVTIGVYVQL